MSEIERSGMIDRRKLSEGSYFSSLVSAGVQCGLLSEGELARLQRELMELEASECVCFTGGRSSSVRTELAQELLESAVFTLGVWLKKFQTPEEALGALKSTSLAEGLHAGQKRIDVLTASAKLRLGLLHRVLVRVENHTYNATLHDGLNGFFQLYSPRFRAHSRVITADYMLAFYPEELCGIEFISEYISCAAKENSMLRLFGEQSVNRAMLSAAAVYGESARELVVNVFSVVLAKAIACAAGETEVLELCLSGEAKRTAAKALKTDGGAEYAFRRVINAFEELSENARAYCARAFTQNKAALTQEAILLAGG